MPQAMILALIDLSITKEQVYMESAATNDVQIS